MSSKRFVSGWTGALLAACIVWMPSGAAAQAPVAAYDAPVAFRAPPVTPRAARAFLLQDGGRPRWVKWGLVGAAAGAVTGALLSGTSSDGNGNTVQDAAVGAVFGFAILGGAIALYDLVCKPDSSSERAGLC